MSTPGSKPVVVGIDGSPASFQALRWAAREASYRGTRLRVVHGDVSALTHVPEMPGVSLPESYHHAVRRQVEQWLRKAAETAGVEVPDAEVDTEMRTGSARTVLIDESKTAQLMVVGSRGLGGFSGLILGSVAVALCRHGHCPVAVLRGPDNGAAIAEQPVVVGVDGSRGGEPALTWAFEAAAARSVELVALHAWHDMVVGEMWTRAQADDSWGSVQDDEERLLAENLAGWRETYPDVAVRQVASYGKPARVLLEHAQNAQLMVLGARGRGGFAGLLLGSTSQTLIHHSPCPVVVAR
ncbi:nucleotide-binding universal stress UspA family protein [Halopolyspora algeriensis]|uniref:Nucleotide-binding universal stress UspA family protein n=1 Tax=Halopolyspora algeriensis TaxID=1500506 RepID=A0A368VKV8_9ACTN|nr:universal stress protein [Halopolyspora algeriensis]RCW39631.1 nucleotide-binding universal stress UspA family protein [Halopolyspora algeriensis]TQM54075.1 nucleotide-binding universal stress UspA family protein [Halopolyspora algeriensis]